MRNPTVILTIYSFSYSFDLNYSEHELNQKPKQLFLLFWLKMTAYKTRNRWVLLVILYFVKLNRGL